MNKARAPPAGDIIEPRAARNTRGARPTARAAMRAVFVSENSHTFHVRGNMKLMTLTFGILPTREQFNECWDKTMEGKSRFQFGNDERVGNDALTQDELWDELGRAVSDMGDDAASEGFVEDSGHWASAVLSVIGIEWLL